jgi:hypothetical protein
MTGFIATPTMRDIERLTQRIDELEQKLNNHRHTYRGPGPMRPVTRETTKPVYVDEIV